MEKIKKEKRRDKKKKTQSYRKFENVFGAECDVVKNPLTLGISSFEGYRGFFIKKV